MKGFFIAKKSLLKRLIILRGRAILITQASYCTVYINCFVQTIVLKLDPSDRIDIIMKNWHSIWPNPQSSLRPNRYRRLKVLLLVEPGHSSEV